jgi:hypothetical protein
MKASSLHHGSNDMASDMDEVLQRVQELTRSARQPGQLSRAQLKSEVEKVATTVRESLAKLGAPLPASAAGKPEGGEKLTEQLKSLRWGFIRT